MSYVGVATVPATTYLTTPHGTALSTMDLSSGEWAIQTSDSRLLDAIEELSAKFDALMEKLDEITELL